jgi:hypothetical protein
VRLRAFIAISAVLSGGHALAQTTANATVMTATNHTAAPTNAAVEKAWSFSASAYTYFVPDSREYVQPTFTADRNRLHLEARYNYEGFDTGSAWVGCNLSAGKKLSLEFTPMLGGVFGEVTGVAPGYKCTLGWRKVELFSEGEYVIDTGNSSASFFYTWSELTLAPVDWFRFGLVVQRTKLYQTDFDVQRGFLIGFSRKQVHFTAYVFNPDASRPTVVLGVGLSF